MNTTEHSPTPAALFGLFPEELNNQILSFRHEQVAEGRLLNSETIDALPHYTFAWNPDFDFKQAAALKFQIESRKMTGFMISVEEIKLKDGDIAVIFNKDLFRLIIAELCTDLDSFKMDMIFTDHIKLLKTPIVENQEHVLLELIKRLLPKEIPIMRIGFGGKLLRKTDLAWITDLYYDPDREQMLKLREFNH